MTPATPSAFGTSLKYDKLKSECGFNVYIVGFGGGWVGAEVDGDVHDLQKEEDERREKVSSEMGLRIVRFGNDEVMRNVSTVVGKIRELL
jgi:very-short-patch-repair endonuclease